MRSRRMLLCAAGGALLVVLAGCGQSSGVATTTAPSAGLTSSAGTPPTTSATPSASAANYFDPAAVSQLFSPGGARRAVPLIVLVPGGGWTSHDNTGLVPLAEQLAAAGFVVVNTSYRALNDGKAFPVPAQDVQCAIAYAAKAAAAAGYGGGPVVVVGHSAGGHLAALAAVSRNALRPQCADPVPPIDGFVGLGGVYDTAALEPYLTSFFGAPRLDNLELWASGDPIAYVEAGQTPKRLRVLLLAGERDFDVPMTQATAFDAALRTADVPVKLVAVPGADHSALYTPEVAAAPIIAFARSLSR